MNHGYTMIAPEIPNERNTRRIERVVLTLNIFNPKPLTITESIRSTDKFCYSLIFLLDIVNQSSSQLQLTLSYVFQHSCPHSRACCCMFSTHLKKSKTIRERSRITSTSAAPDTCTTEWSLPAFGTARRLVDRSTEPREFKDQYHSK